MGPQAPGRNGTAPGLILTEAKVLTVDDDFSLAQAVAITDGVIVAVGTNDEIRELVGPRTVEMALGGRTVVPGLIDSHIHALRAGATWTSELHWEHLHSLAEGVAMIEDRASQSSGSWIRVAGGWHRGQLAEKRLPTSAELTRASPDCPVWVQHLYDRVVFNEAAVRALDITSETPDSFGGEILKDAATGTPVGVAGFGAIRAYAAKLPKPSLDAQVSSTRTWFRELNRFGVTTVNDAAGSGQVWPDSYAAVEALHDAGEQTVRVRWWMQPHVPGHELELIHRFIDTVPHGSGDEWLRPLGIGELPLVAIFDGDGVAAPVRVFTSEALAQWAEVVHAVADSGWGLHVHSTRGHTVEQLLPALEETHTVRSLANRRIYFDHLEDVTPDTAVRIKALGGGITVQHRAAFWGADAFVDLEQARRVPPLRSMVDLDVPLGAGTDATGAASFNPFVSLWWMVSGGSVSGEHARGREQSLSREDALRLYTMGSAWFSFDENFLGSLEPGKAADLTVLSDDYLTIAESDIPSIRSVLTLVAGTPVFSAAEFEGLLPSTGRRPDRA
jgi:predicted amidohydrolase YtcJ